MDLKEYTGKECDKITDFSDFEKLEPCVRHNVLQYVYYQSIDAIQENKFSQVSECDYHISKYGFSCKYDYDDKIIITLDKNTVLDEYIEVILSNNAPLEFRGLSDDDIEDALFDSELTDFEKILVHKYILQYRDKVLPYIEKCLSILPTYNDEYMLKLWMDNGIFLDKEGNFYGSDGYMF